MTIFTWIMFGLVALLMAASGLCWVLFLVLDDSAWKKLAIKVFRISLVFVLLYMNVYIYLHVASALF